MCEESLNFERFGINYIIQICGLKQPSISHLKEAVLAIENPVERERCLMRLVCWSWECMESLGKHWRKLAENVKECFRQAVGGFVIGDVTPEEKIPIDRNMRIILFVVFCHLKEYGVFGECPRTQLIDFMNLHVDLGLQDQSIKNAFIRCRVKKPDNLINHVVQFIVTNKKNIKEW